MKTGFGRLCITPPLGVAMSGYYEARYVKGVLDDLFVSAIAFDNGKEKAVVLAVDTLLFSATQSDVYRKIIADFCEIPMDAVFINCSHTHTGPLVGVDIASDLKSSPLYDEFIGIQMRDAAKLALEDLCDSTFFVAEGEAKKISFVRRFRMKDGSVQTNPGVGNPNIDHALGEPNETVKLIKIERDDAEDIFIVNFGVHPDVIGGEYISADYPGFVCSTIEDAIPDSRCVFLLAPQGDVNHINPNPTKGESRGLHPTFDGCPRGYEHSMHMGRVIAGAVLQICDKAELVEVDDIKFSSKKIICPSNQENHRLDEARRIVKIHEEGRDSELPYKAMELTTVVSEAVRIVELENGPEAYEFTLSAISIGDIAFAGIPCEPFTEIANRVYAESPFGTTIFCCLTNGGDSYFPTSRAYDEGGYEARSSKLKKGVDDIAVNGMLELLEKIKNM